MGEGEGTLTLEAAGIRVGVSESCSSVPAKSLPGEERKERDETGPVCGGNAAVLFEGRGQGGAG